MKKLTLLIALLLVVLSTNVFAQTGATAVASAQATIVTPIGITKTVDMNFGNLAVNATNGGTAILTPAGARSVTGGVTIPVANPGTVTAASFDITGTAAYTYAITLPAGATTVSDGTNDMTVDTWTSTPDATGTISGGGTQTITVGATLHVTAAQPANVYNSTADFSVKVDYN
jgi:hypothetical protein